MLDGKFKKNGYDWWWHSFTGINKKTGEEKAFFIEFFIVNPALSKDKVILGQDKDRLKPSYLMIKCGTWGKNKCQLHNFYPIDNVKITSKPYFQVECENNICSETRLKGSVECLDYEDKPQYMSNNGKMAFDLTLDKKIAFNVGYGASKFFRFIKAFQMYWHAQGMKTLFSGTVTFNDEEYIVDPETSYGYSDKNWGSDFTSPWLWLSSNNVYSNIQKKQLTNTVFDIGGGKPKIFFVSLDRKLLSALYYEGEEIEFNFSKFWERVHTKFSFKEDNEKGYWHVEQKNNKYLIDVNIECLKKDMLYINYESPKGEKKYTHLNNGGNGIGNIKLYKLVKKEKVLIDDMDVKNVGCEYGEFDESVGK